MPKSLGQIHTVKFNYEKDVTTGINQAHLCDVSGKLTQQFNRQIRQMCNYKIVGIDLVAQLPELVPTLESDRVICKGRLRYMQLTKGRCDAMRTAYQQLRSEMKTRGIDPKDNKGYDFRVPLRAESNYPTNVLFDTVSLTNLAAFGATPLSMIDNVIVGAEVFGSHNAGVLPTIASQTFSTGLFVSGESPNDFVANEGIISQGNPNYADVEMEEIPFELAYDSTARRVTQFNWRPDPALYLSIMTGQIEIVLDEISAAGATGTNIPGIEIDCSIHVAGWKSFVRPPSSRSRSSKKMKGGKK